MRIGAVTAPFTDVLNVRVDGTIVQSYPEPAVAEADYTLRTINLNAFANGAAHQLLFEYIGPSSGTADFTVDNVSLTTGGACPSPSRAERLRPHQRRQPQLHLQLHQQPHRAATTFTQNFDGVVAPALPAGWTTAATGIEVPWVTSTTNPASAPNDAFAPDVTNIGNTELITPTIAAPAGGGVLTFQNLFNMEFASATTGYDGMVLEISIAGGAYADILAAGGSFVTGGYTHTISTGFMSPIAGRMAWSGALWWDDGGADLHYDDGQPAGGRQWAEHPIEVARGHRQQRRRGG